MFRWLKRSDKKSSTKKSVPFLRKGAPLRRIERTVKRQPRYMLPDVILLWGIFFGTVIYLTLFSHFFLVSSIQVLGTHELSAEQLQKFVEQEIAGKYLSTVPRRGFFVMRPRALEERLRTEYPLLSSVRVVRIFPDGARIIVTERENILVVCSGEHCFLVDESGVAHENTRAVIPENLPYVLFVDDMSSTPLAASQPVFDPKYGTFIVRMSTLFPERIGIDLEPRYTMVSRFANEVRVKTREGWEVYFSTGIPIESSLKVLVLLLDRELLLEKRNNLAYIDLRTENRAYYAFRDDEANKEKTTSTTEKQEDEKEKEK